jgi:hypothetical protein
MSGVSPDQPVGDEVEALRSRVAELEAQLASADATLRLQEQPPPRPPRGGLWRPFVAVALILVGALLAPVAVVATWLHDEVADTDRYVDTVAPLADDPAIQAAITDNVTEQIFSRLDVEELTQQAVDALAARGLSPRAARALSALSQPIASGVRSFVEDQVARVVASDGFAQAWEAANREAHEQMVLALTGSSQGAVELSGGAVTVNLAAVIDTVKQRLTDSGFALAARIPTVNAEFVVMQSADLEKAQRAFRLLDTLGWLLPVASVGFLAAGVAVARSRRRALIGASLGVIAALVLLGLSLNIFREVYLDAIPPGSLPTDAAAVIYDELVGFIRLNIRALLVVFLAIAAIAWVTGPGPGPSRVREVTGRGVDVVRHGSDRAGLDTGRFGSALYQYRTALRALVLGGALLVYVMADHPTGAWTLTVLVVALLVLLVVELLARPPRQPAVE